MKSFLTAGLVMLAAATAQASYLYWQIDTTSTDGMEAIQAALDEYNTKWKVADADKVTISDIAGARLVQVDNASTATPKESTVADRVGVGQFNEPRSANVPTIDISTMGENYSYYIELVSNKSSLPYSSVAKSEMKTYAELQEFVYVGNEMDIPQISLNAWTGGAYTAAPEPTSGLLVLIGVGLLGLKRKRA